MLHAVIHRPAMSCYFHHDCCFVLLYQAHDQMAAMWKELEMLHKRLNGSTTTNVSEQVIETTIIVFCKLNNDSCLF